jgi:hypothetical protein
MLTAMVILIQVNTSHLLSQNHLVIVSIGPRLWQAKGPSVRVNMVVKFAQ